MGRRGTPCKPVSSAPSSASRRRRGLAGLFGNRRSSGRHPAPLRHLWPGRNGFVNLAEGTAKRIVKKDQVFNRIRVEDIGAATRFLAERKLGGIYNVTDNEPAPPQDVVTYAAELMGVAPPPETDFETAQLSPMARSFYGENKRVSNARIRALGFEFAYPDYRVSLANLWNCGNWRP